MSVVLTRMVKKQLVIEPEEAKIVRLIYAKYLGGAGYRAIANFLNRQGYQTVKRMLFLPRQSKISYAIKFMQGI